MPSCKRCHQLAAFCFALFKPVWQPSLNDNGQYLQLSFSYPSNFWPWSGYLAVSITVSEEAQDYDGCAEGFITLELESPWPTNSGDQERLQSSVINLYLKAKIIPTPLRRQRILWDQFHNLRYPSGYFPRDDLKMKSDPLDWNADHVRMKKEGNLGFWEIFESFCLFSSTPTSRTHTSTCGTRATL